MWWLPSYSFQPTQQHVRPFTVKSTYHLQISHENVEPAAVLASDGSITAAETEASHHLQLISGHTPFISEQLSRLHDDNDDLSPPGAPRAAVL